VKAAPCDFGDAICSTLMCPGHFCPSAERLHNLSDFLAVCGHDHIMELRALTGCFPDVLEQWLSRGIQQKFSGQPG
jgi:hypothetical protein